MKFSVKSIYPISTSLNATKSRFNWELGVVGVEYLFMGDGSCDGLRPAFGDRAQITEENHEFIYVSIDGLNAKLQLDTRSGRYRQRYAVRK
ncbi:hypothetical protein [Anabaena subtropica]|uniref:Uncharacterized protein n=1 Tax=Anabaena subtropica FACHB-260 TaxID=2692884 RepID=A0ABR8CUU7_9NOST|nr:hypothetical protein [Anabaena subtropica]MBD2346960.1 hypothetical protein [Anabaena subtropica FACHB-260]